MLGAIAGDIIGSVHEHAETKTKDFPLFDRHSTFTDDSVLTVAVAEAIIGSRPYRETIREVCFRHPTAGYGASFRNWLLLEQDEPYGSWGNGSAMRVSPVGFAFDDVDTVMAEATKSAEVTHNHPEGVKGAQATALAVFLARGGANKEIIRREITSRFGYDLERTIDSIRPDYRFDVSCQGSVPEAIIAFLDSDSFEDAVRNAISLGGDADTLACIAGSIAEAYYGEIPSAIVQEVRARLSKDLLEGVDRFVAWTGR